jgi:uncharacterized protein (DUF2252 family)
MSKKIVLPGDRKKALERLRLLKMASSAHAFMRGSTDQFYDWIKSGKVSKSLPISPPVWICGDCHTGNLGPVADMKGNIDIQIRDLDQTVIGNSAYDLIRLAVSLAMAARSADLPGVTTGLMVEAMIEAYTAALTGKPPREKVKEVAPLNKVMQNSLKRKWRHLAEERIEDVRPRIPLGSKFWPLTKREQSGLKKLLDDPKQRDFLRLLTRNKNNDKVSLVDAAYWVKGCSSLGRVRYAALVRVAKRYRLIDIKEATQAIAPPIQKGKMPANNAERVVMGAQHLSPFLGERTVAASLDGHQVVIRELRPQDVKFELSAITQREAVLTAKLFAGVLGKAHGRQMKSDVSSAWRKDLKTLRTKNLNAPSWLWKSVVELIGLHEASYLEHCRKFALSKAFDPSKPQ